MIKTEILETDWKSFDETKTKPKTPYWFKMENGNVVLAAHLTTSHCSGWAKVSFDKNGELVMSGNSFYLLKGAKLQPALQE